jgi:uncharacterized FlgJ-related protein
MEKTAIEWFLDNIPSRYRNAFLNDCKEEIERAKEIEAEREYILKAFWFGRGIAAEKYGKMNELRPRKLYDTEGES